MPASSSKEEISRQPPRRKVDQRGASRDLSGLEGNFEPDGNSRLTPLLVSAVEAVHDQQPKRFWVHGAPHEVVESDLAKLITERLRVLIDDDDANRRLPANGANP